MVGATVLSATTLDVNACTGTDLMLGTLTTATTSITPSDCDITFGSSNDSSTLRLVQADERGAAMTQWSPTGTMHRAAPQVFGMAAASATEAWLVGVPLKAGTPTPVAHTTDSGATWVSQSSCVAGALLYDVSYVSGSTVVAAGANNVVCRTTDGGATWTQVIPSTGATWKGLDILPSGEGWLGGGSGRVQHTTDGGASWTLQATMNPAWTIERIHAASSTNVYAVAMSNTTPTQVYALSSSDGGATWNSFLVGDSVQAGWGYAVTALTPTVALVGTVYGTWRTTNSGNTWTQVDAQPRLCLVTLDASTVLGYYGGGTTRARKSTDGGVTWANVPASPVSSGQQRACDSGSPTTAFVGGFNDQRWHTADSGDTHVIWTSSYQNQAAVDGWSGDRFISVGNLGSVRRTTDGGASVTTPASGTAADLRDVVAFGDEVRVAVAVGVSGTIIRSVDGGATWAAVASGTGNWIEAIDRASDGTLVAVGGAGLVLRSLDDGATWHTLPAAGASSLMDVDVASRDDIWVVGVGGEIYRTSNAGATWAAQTSGTTMQLISIDSLDGQNAIATTVVDAALQSGVLRTSDGGATWTLTMTTTGTNYSYQVQYLDATTVVISSSNGYRRSTDGGVTWTTIPTPFVNLFGIAAVDMNSFVIAGEGDLVASVSPTASVSDYAIGTYDFSGSTGAFGACLETQVGASTTVWPVAGNDACTSGNLAMWRAVSNDPLTSGVASRATPGSSTLAFRFGMKPAANQRSGDYLADLRFEVVAPST